MENRHGFVLLLTTGILQSALLLSECAPLPYPDTGEPSGGASVSGHVVLGVSLMALVAMLVLLVNCMTCCKEREINFKEFEDNFDDEVDFTPPAEDTPSMQSPAEVYTLAVPPVALPGPPHLQPPPRILEGSAGSQLARHSLSYIQEIGSGWFGKVLLSETYTDPGAARVVVKELKANASAKEQNDFLQQGDPYRVLQHPNILQCLGQCVEAIPFLLVFEYCEMGDLRSYMSQQDWMFRNAELLQLQKMACEIAAGVTHLHKHNFLHSDLALRNCYLTADLTVKVGDYGIGPYRYKEDYVITEDDVSAPLRWLAPELVGERHGGVITMEQTKPGNVWALGVTLWELFENAAQPYSHLSDREVLNHVIREQQIKLFKPQLELPYSDRWYEVLQFCWLSTDKRATAEEVHRLLTYLRMQGQKDVEDDFEQRWDSLKPNPTTRQTTVSHSSYPILEQFSDDALRPEIDEVLTVTETSRGLSFEYVWEAAKHDHYDSSHGRSAMDTTLNYHSMFFPVPSEDIQAHFPDPAGRTGATETGPTPSGIPGILPVIDAQKPSSGSEYYIQLEEQGESNVEGNDNTLSDTISDRQQIAVLQDVRLDESSTDADFFNRSIDSKDSFLQDSHIWSSSEHESPYHPNIFSERDSRQEISHSWDKDFMELPELNGNEQETTSEGVSRWENKSFGDSFLAEHSEDSHPQNSLEEDSKDVMKFLNTEKLAANFLFLKESSLMKDGSGSSGRSMTVQPDFLQPGLVHDPENSFKMSSWDNLVTLDGLNIAESHLKPTESPITPKEELFDLVSPSLEDVPLSLVENETLVPLNSLASEEIVNSQLPVRHSSSSDDFGLLPSSDMGDDSALDWTSANADIPFNPYSTYQSESATSNLTCTDAKKPRLEDHLGPLEPADFQGPTSTSAYGSLAVVENSLSEGLTSDNVLSELMDDTEVEIDTILSDNEEPLKDEDEPPVRSSLLVSGTSMDQISQDSLLEDSISTTLPTVENSANTPDSLDSLDIHRLDGQVDLNTPIAPHKLQPPYKTADSGYETENLESPEWNSQPLVKEHSVEENDLSIPEEEKESGPVVSATLVPPEIIVSEVESSPDVQDEDSSTDAQRPEPVALGDESFIGGSYRDSAYFSDNESEAEKKSEETNEAGSAEVSWLRSSPTDDVSGDTGGLSVIPMDPEDLLANALVSPLESLAPAESLFNVAVRDGKPLSQGESGLPELVLTSEEDWETAVPVSIDSNEEETRRLQVLPDVVSSTQSEVGKPFDDAPAPAFAATAEKALPENMVHAKLTRTYASDCPKLKEPDMEGLHLGRRDGSGADGPEDGMEADEEDENSDDSDDDIRAYRLHSSSSESEDDTVHPVPVIVSDDSSARNLKSLLKPTSPNVASEPPMPPEGQSAHVAKRAVSFFDDVTVYLFDQETPTKELGDHSSGSNSQVSEFSSPVPSASYLNRFANSESSTDEEGGGFEWDDDFSPEASFLSTAAKDLAQAQAMPIAAASRYFSPPPVGRAPEPSWATSSSNYSRFSISPASIANFSLTHLTDSDIEQGGSSEDGEKD